MPELPDLTIVAEAFHAALADRPITSATAVSPLTLRGLPAELDALTGQRVRSIMRRGKFLVMDLDRDRTVFSPMLTGRFQLTAGPPPTAGPAPRPGRPALVVAFGPRSRRVRDHAPWTRSAAWLPADEARPEVRYRDPTQMGKVYLLPAGGDRTVPGFAEGELGPDADDPRLTVDVWHQRIRRHPGELKNLLRNQAFVAGIGNAYSDEILHAAGLLPFRRRSTLADEEIIELHRATRQTLARAIEILRERVPPTFETQVRDFLAVHMKGGQACPRCGTRISQIKAGGFVTSYCRGCQR